MRVRARIGRSPPLRSPSPRALSLGFALALGLHALGLGLVALVARPLLVVGVAPVAAQPAEAPLTWFEPDEPPRPVAQPGAGEAGAGEPSGSAAARQVALAVTPRRQLPGRRGAPASVGDEDTDSGGETGREEGAARDGPPAARADKRLSLEALGVGPGHNPFLAPEGRRPDAKAMGQRLDHVLRSGLAEHDRQLGLGPEGPAVAAVTDLVMQSTTAPNTDALLVLRTDGNGETVYVGLAEASGDSAAWDAIAQSLLRALHGKKLRVPSGSGGVTMQLRVSSRVQLPSGADPGLAIDLFGKEIQAGAGERSTRLQILTPKIVVEQYQISSTDPHLTIPVIGLGINLLALQGDPVDIAAVARRVVHAHLVSMETHPPEPKQ
jgi:hypothetical protein